MEPLKNSLRVAWCTGSGYVMRRQALEDIGRFPTYSLAEDVFTSSLMLGSGWKTIYVNEPLQYGLMPDSLAAHLKQRTRWVSNISSRWEHFSLFPYANAVDEAEHWRVADSSEDVLLSIRGECKTHDFVAAYQWLVSKHPSIAMNRDAPY